MLPFIHEPSHSWHEHLHFTVWTQQSPISVISTLIYWLQKYCCLFTKNRCRNSIWGSDVLRLCCYRVTSSASMSECANRTCHWHRQYHSNNFMIISWDTNLLFLQVCKIQQQIWTDNVLHYSSPTHLFLAYCMTYD
jgi:hypothetical protein